MTTTLSLSAFRARFPEFRSAEDSLVLSHLDQAHRMFDEQLYGRNYLDAVGYMTAEMLSLSPFGTNARGEGETSIYKTHLDRLALMIPSSPLVLGGRGRLGIRGRDGRCC